MLSPKPCKITHSPTPSSDQPSSDSSVGHKSWRGRVSSRSCKKACFSLGAMRSPIRPSGPGSFERGLDVCCGTGGGVKMLRNICSEEAVGIDFSEGMLGVAQQELGKDEGTPFRLVHGDAFAMDFDKIPSASYKATAMVRPDALNKLRASSQKRRSASEDFDKLLKDIEKYREQKAKNKLSLNEKKFFAERAELDADKEEEKQFEEKEDDKDKAVFERNYYNDEVLDITVDYVNLLREAKVAAN